MKPQPLKDRGTILRAARQALSSYFPSRSRATGDRMGRGFFFLKISLVVSAMVAAGCKSDPYADAYIESLASENRALEEHILRLEMELEDYRSGGARAPASRGAAGTPAQPAGGQAEPAGRAEPGADEEPDLSIPKIEEGVPVDPSEVLPRPPANPVPQANPTAGGGNAPLASASAVERTAASAAMSAEDLPAPKPPGSEHTEVTEATSDASVRELFINPRWTRGRNVDGVGGDDVLNIAVEPRDQYGRFVPVVRPIKIAVLDPARQGEAARIALWSFDVNQVRVGLQHAGPEPLILLQGVWPKRPPEHPRLVIWARCEMSDGRLLQTRQTVHIDASGRYSMRWTPRQQRRSSGGRANLVRQAPASAGPDSEGPRAETAQRASNLAPWSPQR